MSTLASPKQVRSLLILYRAAGGSADREARLRWASQQLGRRVSSFNELTRQEYQRLRELCEMAAMGLVP